MNKKNRWKAVLAIAVALAFVMPVAAVANNEKTDMQTTVLVDTDDENERNKDTSLLGLDVIDDENNIMDMVHTTINILGSTITIYVNTSAIDGRNDLNASQKTALKKHILDHIKSNFEGALGSGNVTVTDDPTQQGGADRNVSIEPGMSDPPGSAWGQCHGGNNTVKVFLGEFMNDSNVNGSFQNPDGSWNITKLGNAIGHTAGHEVGHTYSVGHNHNERPKPPAVLPPDENDNRSKMTEGGHINATERATTRFNFDNHTKDVIKKNLGKDACEAFPDYDMKVLLAHYWGPSALPDKPDEAGSLDVTFDFYTEMPGYFELGFLGEDTDNGVYDGNSEFDFIYKTSLLNDEDLDARIMTFICEFHDYTTWLLRGSEESPYPGEWFMLDEKDVTLSDFIETPAGDIVARKVEMIWPYQGVGVFFDALSFGKASNPYNGFTYEFVPSDDYKMHYPQLPDEDGWDVYATAGLTQPQYPQVCLADDWLCTEAGPVSDIHFWGSWLNDTVGTITSFIIAIYTDIPAEQNPDGYSKPGECLWERTFYPGEWTEVRIDSPYLQGWYDPSAGYYIENDHNTYYQYNIVDITEPIIQEKGTIYWLSISASVKEMAALQPLWGWKSTEDHWNDDACWSYWGDLYWIDIYEPSPPKTNDFWVSFDPAGNIVDAGGTDYYDDGTGASYNGWYFYENTDWWNIWFYDDPFDPERYKEINIWFDAFLMDPDHPAFLEVAVNWATDSWPPGNPPPIPPIENEELYIGRDTLFKGEHFEGHYEFDYTISGYNPEWVSVDVRGYNFKISRGQITHECLPKQSLDLAFVITGEAGEWYWKSDYPNYAPSGMPDFDQNQDKWKAINDGGNGIAETTATGDDIQIIPVGDAVSPYGVVVAPGPNYQLDTRPSGDDVAKWAFCGPVAVANCFWWFDSKYADPNGWPGDGEDEFPLVENYGVRDDHSSDNVPLLIEKLAGAMGTCSNGTTYIDDMQLAIDNWFIDTDLDNMFEENTYDAPTFEFIESEIERSQDVILLLGYYDYEEPVKIIDQQQTLWETNDNLQTFTWWDYQSFTPMVSTLDAIQLYLVSNGPPCDIEINVYDSGRNLIGSLIHNPGILPNPTWYQFHFVSTIPLKDETHYFDVRQLEDGYHYEWFYMPYITFDPYTGGQGWMDTKPTDYYGNPFDWTFKTEYYSGGGNECIRKGGHYVTCAGVNSDGFMIAFSDPRWNISEPSPNNHNDAQYVSHDIYRVSIGSPCPDLDYQWWLPNYPSDHDYTIVEQAVVICPKPDVEINKWVWDGTTQEWVDEIDADVGETVSFKIDVHNNGGYNLTNIVVTDTLPFCLEYVEGSADPPPTSVEENIITWDFPGPLSYCHTITIYFDAKVVSIGENINYVDVYADTIEGNVSDNDTATVNAIDTTPPVITDVLATPPTQVTGGYVNITATVTDNVAVDTVLVDITSPTLATEIMTNIPDTDTYYYNTTYTEIGTYDYFIWANDTSGNEATSSTKTFEIIEPDTTPPVTTHEFDGTMGDNDWYVSDVIVTLTATDDASGVEFTYYKIDSGGWQEYDDEFTIIDDGMHMLYYYSVDFAGNVEDTNEADFKIDQTPPAITLAAEKVSFGTYNLIADVSDATSGVAKVEFYVNSVLVGTVTTAPYEYEVSGCSQGDTATATVYDNAGNSKVSNEVTPQSHSQSQKVWLLQFLERHPQMFPTLKHLLGL